MKKIISVLLLLPSILVAQNMYNVFPVVENTISGTARYIGMGGSMGALGGDISVIGSNPAGIALFHSN
ncbi:MAG: TonB-dependent receptor, partial [Bacteroidaceae bacterium]|nr:TonB-dependent receptor [Bacteroidaceae bacterium]